MPVLSNGLETVSSDAPVLRVIPPLPVDTVPLTVSGAALVSAKPPAPVLVNAPRLVRWLVLLKFDPPTELPDNVAAVMLMLEAKVFSTIGPPATNWTSARVLTPSSSPPMLALPETELIVNPRASVKAMGPSASVGGLEFVFSALSVTKSGILLAELFSVIAAPSEFFVRARRDGAIMPPPEGSFISPVDVRNTAYSVLKPVNRLSVAFITPLIVIPPVDVVSPALACRRPATVRLLLNMIDPPALRKIEAGGDDITPVGKVSEIGWLIKIDPAPPPAPAERVRVGPAVVLTIAEIGKSTRMSPGSVPAGWSGDPGFDVVTVTEVPAANAVVMILASSVELLAGGCRRLAEYN